MTAEVREPSPDSPETFPRYLLLCWRKRWLLFLATGTVFGCAIGFQGSWWLGGAVGIALPLAAWFTACYERWYVGGYYETWTPPLRDRNRS